MAVEAGATLSYAWFDDNAPAGTNESLDTTGLSGTFRVEVTATGTTSQTVRSADVIVTAAAIPVITSPGLITSSGELGKIGEPHSVSGVVATGGGALTFEWFNAAASLGNSPTYTPTQPTIWRI